MALCESQLDNLHQIKSETDSGPDTPENEKKPPPIPHPHPGNWFSIPLPLNTNMAPNLTVPLAVDYRSPRAHFVPPEVEMYAVQSRRLPSSSQESGSNTSLSTIGSNASGVPMKRKRGRPRIDKTSPEYLAKSAARKQAREMVAVMNSSSDSVEKRKRGRPRVDKTSPEYLARKRARELEAMEKKAKRQFKRRTTGAKIVTKASKSGTKITTTTASSRMIKKVPAKGKPKLAGKGARQLPQKGAMNKSRQLPQKVGKSRKPTAKERVVVMRRSTKFVKRKKDSASSSTGDTTPRTKRKYTKRPSGPGGAVGGEDTPKKRGRKKKMILGPDGQPIAPPPKVKGKRGRPRKLDGISGDHVKTNSKPPMQQAKIRVRNNLMPINSEPIPVDSEDEPDLGSPGRASDSLSLDENLRALRHLHEKYANIGKDDLYQAHLLAANFKSPGALPPNAAGGGRYPGAVGVSNDDEVLSVRSSSPGNDEAGKVEKLEDSSDSDSDDSSSSESGSTSSGSSSSSSSGSTSSSDSSDESEPEKNGPAAIVAAAAAATPLAAPAMSLPLSEDRSFGSWSYNSASRSPRSESNSGTGSDAERADAYGDERGASLSESENESPDKSFQCNVCKKWYSTSVTLKIHRRVHVTRGAGNSKSRARSKDRYECDCCDEVFTRREKLLEHRAVAHRGAMTVRCEVCRRCFEDDAELAAHDRTHTHDERAGRCSDCGASFPRYELLRRHRACAHPREARGTAPQRESGGGGGGGRHTCRQCGKVFGHAHSLTRHLHNHAKQLYRCVVCKASFARADQLAQHLNSHLANYKRLKP